MSQLFEYDKIDLLLMLELCWIDDISVDLFNDGLVNRSFCFLDVVLGRCCRLSLLSKTDLFLLL